MQPPAVQVASFNQSELPAILIGGPPHSGKSVLTYSLTHALRRCKVDHYVLRACPDGEGDWANQADQALVRRIRQKGAWSGAWVEQMVRDIERRHLPLLVDVGGLPTLEQERILAACTHAILLTRDGASQQEWRQRMARCQVPVIADLTSSLHGDCQIHQRHPLHGRITRLHRGQHASGPLFDALLESLLPLLALGKEGLTQLHLAHAPTETTVHLERLGQSLGLSHDETGTPWWRPTDLPALVDYLPAGQALSLYGRAPIWVSGCAAALCLPQPCHLFDVRLGWVQVPALPLGQSNQSQDLRLTAHPHTGYTRLTIEMLTHYVDYGELGSIAGPQVDGDQGVLLDGRAPNWLVAGLARAYAHAAWVACYEPRLHAGIVIASRQQGVPLGSTLPVVGEKRLGD